MSLLPNLDQMTDNEKLAVLESIQKSIAESKEIQKKKIGENVDLVVQALKKIESDIRDRFDAVGNSIEKRVLSIQDGRDGADGKDGRDGKDGKSGKDGLKGDRGVDGQAGRDGVDGVDGISVVNAQIDFDGSLVITLSDGRELNVGEVVSQDIAEKIKVISTMSTNGAIGIKDEGTSISTGVKTINFVGAAVTATNSGDDVTVNVSSGTGTVTSVALSGGTTGLTVSGSPITTSGTITLAGTLALVNGGTGATTASGARTALGLVIGTDVLAPTGSAASLTSFPTFNQNTTGSAATLTTGRTIAVTGDLAYTSPSFDGSANVTAAGTLATVNTNVGSFTNASVTVNGKGLVTAASSGTVPVTSVTGTSPVASSGGATPAISLAASYGDTQNPYASKTANFVLAAPNGSAGVPTFRAVVAADIPTLNQNTTGSAATVTTTINSGVVATTQTAGDNSTKVATTAYVNAITGTSGITGFKNRIINGAMVIDQRNAGASVSVGTATGTYTLDRWRVYHDTAITSNITAQQSTTVPTIGYINSQILTNGTAATAAAGDVNVIQQRVEGLNVADLNFGSATAATVTLSFWVRSSLTGTFGVTLANSAQNRSYVSTYTISAANTWEQKTVTVAGDQSGTWLTTSGIGLIASWDLGSGTSLNTTAGAWQAGQYFRTSACTSFIGTTGATFYITGVQLEKGSTATSFDYRPYGTELALAQRYCLVKSQANGATTMGNGWWNGSTTAALLWMSFPVSMRSAPTASQNGGTWKQETIASSFTATGTLQGSTFGTDGGWINWSPISGGTGTSAQPTGGEITSGLTMVLTLSSEL